MARPRYARPTDAELQILAVLWRRGGSTVRETFLELRTVRGSGYNSVLKLMQIMHDKGLVKRDDSRRPQIYSAAWSEQATKQFLIRDLVVRVFDGSSSALVVEAIKAQKVSTSELGRIRSALKAA